MVDGLQGRSNPGWRPGFSRIVPFILPHVGDRGHLAPHDDLLGGGTEAGHGLASYSCKQHTVAAQL